MATSRPMAGAPLHPRSRVQRLVAAARARQSTGGAPADPVPPAPVPVSPQPLDLLDRTLRAGLPLPGRLARSFEARLTAEDRAAVEAFLADGGIPGHGPELAENPAAAVPLALHLHESLPGIEQRLGLTALDPPDDVHAMARGPLAVGGSIYDADLLTELLDLAGLKLEPGRRVLDFGCSSGRVVRVLQAAVEGLDLWGCDPNHEAIAWAQEHLPGITFHASPTEPPLPFLEDATVDLTLAVSIWSHFDREPALEWLEEMRRITKPGGHLLLTTHGFESVAFYGALPDHALEDQRPIAHELYRSGHAFHPIFGEEGDWGVKHTGWGQAFFTADWLAAHICPRWSIQLFLPGAVHGNQDAYVLRREV